MKIQDGALVTSVTSQLRYDSSNRFISRRLISGVSFMSISSIVLKNGGGRSTPLPPVQERPEKPSLNRVQFSGAEETLKSYKSKSLLISSFQSLKAIHPNKEYILSHVNVS